MFGRLDRLMAIFSRDGDKREQTQIEEPGERISNRAGELIDEACRENAKATEHSLRAQRILAELSERCSRPAALRR